MYHKYNDCELIKEIKEGNDRSLEILLKKYDPYIISYIYKIRKYYDEDSIQEARLVLYKSIYEYEENDDYNFFSYFNLCLKRKIKRIIEKENKEKKIIEMIKYSEVIDNEGYQMALREKLYFPDLIFKSSLEEKIYEECIIKEVKLTDLSNNLNVPYKTLYYHYKKVLKKLFDDVGSYIYKYN